MTFVLTGAWQSCHLLFQSDSPKNAEESIKAGTGLEISGSGWARALRFGLRSGSGLGILDFWAQISLS